MRNIAELYNELPFVDGNKCRKLLENMNESNENME